MRRFRDWALVLPLLALGSSWIGQTQAAVVGIATDNAAAVFGAEAAVTAAGHTPVLIASLGDPLSGFDVVWVLNTENGPPILTAGNEINIATYVSLGGVLSFHDRNVNQGQSAAAYIPGAGGITFVSNFSDNIDVVTPGTLVTNGPAGVIDDTTLDGGGFSNQGYAQVATLPVGATHIFSDGDATHAVDFTYQFGAGFVYYSSIPLDAFLEGGGNPFATIYATNEVAYQVSLAQPSTAPIPEPTSLAIWSLVGLISLALLRQRHR